MDNEFFVMRSRNKAFNETEQEWMTILENQLQEVKRHNIPYMRIAFISIYGSQNYHLAGPYSDVDSECFIFPSVDDFCFIRTPTSFKIHTEYGDVYVKDIRQMFDELRKCSPNILELLASDYMWINREYLYYLLPIFMEVDQYAQLSTYKLLKGLEGLLRRYTNSIELCPKYLVNAMRIEQMIERIIQGEDFSSTLIPENCDELFQIKIRNPLPTDEEALHNITFCSNEMLHNYFSKHELVFNPKVKEIINDAQKDLLIKYLHNV